MTLTFFLVSNTAKLKPDWTVGSGFSSISPSNLDQISKSGTVLKSWERVDFKTVPDFGIWPRFDGEIEEKPDPTVQFGLDFAVCTHCPEIKREFLKRGRFVYTPHGFLPISLLPLGQNWNIMTVLESAWLQLSKTVLIFQFWTSRSWDVEARTLQW